MTGMDGGHLAELLLGKGYEVYGMRRRNSSPTNQWRLRALGIEERITLLEGDMGDTASLMSVIERSQPDEVYNLAAQSHVGISFEEALATTNVTGVGFLRLLEAVRQRKPDARVYQAGSSEMFGNCGEMPPKGYNEGSPMCPASPYAAAKLYAHNLVRIYREAYGMYIVGGILFNHEGILRGQDFVTRKVTDGVARIVCRQGNGIALGNMWAERDWGYAPEFCTAMWLMLQQEKPDDYVIATGEKHSVMELVEEAFGCVDHDWHEYVRTNGEFIRPLDVNTLLGDYSKAERQFGWRPRVKFKELVRIMVAADIDRWKRAMNGEVIAWDAR